METPAQSAASSVPGAEQLLGRVDVTVESVEADTFGAAVLASIPVSILIRVTSRQESPRLRVEARRFYLEADKSAKILPRSASQKEPQLPAAYLKAGETATGWLTFEVPRGAKQLILKSDMRRPPFEVPIAIPGGLPGG